MKFLRVSFVKRKNFVIFLFIWIDVKIYLYILVNWLIRKKYIFLLRILFLVDKKKNIYFKQNWVALIICFPLLLLNFPFRNFINLEI